MKKINFDLMLLFKVIWDLNGKSYFKMIRLWTKKTQKKTNFTCQVKKAFQEGGKWGRKKFKIISWVQFVLSKIYIFIACDKTHILSMFIIVNKIQLILNAKYWIKILVNRGKIKHS
jgi:hypothetical protein